MIEIVFRRFRIKNRDVGRELEITADIVQKIHVFLGRKEDS